MTTTETFHIDDPVYKGYVPNGLTFEIPEHLERWNNEDFSTVLQEVTQKCFQARQEEGQRRLDALPAKLLDPARERLYLAGLQGDRFLAEEIILRGLTCSSAPSSACFLFLFSQHRRELLLTFFPSQTRSMVSPINVFPHSPREDRAQSKAEPTSIPLWSPCQPQSKKPCSKTACLL